MVTYFTVYFIDLHINHNVIKIFKIQIHNHILDLFCVLLRILFLRMLLLLAWILESLSWVLELLSMVLLWLSRVLLELSWVLLGLSWELLGLCCVLLGLSWVLLGLSWVLFKLLRLVLGWSRHVVRLLRVYTLVSRWKHRHTH